MQKKTQAGKTPNHLELCYSGCGLWSSCCSTFVTCLGWEKVLAPACKCTVSLGALFSSVDSSFRSAVFPIRKQCVNLHPGASSCCLRWAHRQHSSEGAPLPSLPAIQQLWFCKVGNKTFSHSKPRTEGLHHLSHQESRSAFALKKLPRLPSASRSSM